MDITDPNFTTKNTEGVYPPQIPQIQIINQEKRKSGNHEIGEGV